jgi:uncharacterized OB-fold protein
LTQPAPNIDELSAPFWEALRQHHVVVQRCPACGRQRFPRLPSCPYCGTVGGVDAEIDGTGTVYSFVGVERALTPAFAGDAPYAIVTVDLDGGGRILGRLDPYERAAIGLRVEPSFVDHDGWTELRFAALD